MFSNKWKNRKIINLNHPRVKVDAFKAILKYLYTGRLDTHIDHAYDVQILARQCKLTHLYNQIDEEIQKIERWESTKRGTNITTVTIENYTQSIDFNLLVEQALPPSLRTWIGGEDMPCLTTLSRPLFADIAIKVEGELFRCHKVFFCCRSDYFKAMISDHFLEHEETLDLPVYTMHDISVDTFRGLLSYIYIDQADLNKRNVFEMLMLSDLYLLGGLKRQAAAYLGTQLSLGNVIDIIKVARLLELTRLEAQCTEFMANNVESVIKLSEFRQLIVDDAKQVISRQETDTIDVIDDIRYYITSHCLTITETEEANEKLRLIDNLLEELDLEG